MTTPLAWGARVGPEFRVRVIELCKRIGIPDPSWLMACMMFESGLDPARVNAVSGATGLIQFMPSTARALGTTVEALARMPAYEQLTWVERYLQPYTGKLKTLTDCYMAILYPIAIGKPDSAIVFAAPSLVYEQNKTLDTDHDGRVTKLEACAFVVRRLEEGLLPTNVASVYASEVLPAAAPTPAPGPQSEPDPQPAPPSPAPVQPPKEGRMGALSLLQLFSSILGPMIPQIAPLLGAKGAQVQQYAGIADTVLKTITSATGAPNLQGAIEAMQTDPSVKAKVQEAVVTHPEVIGLMELGSGGVGGARAAALAVQNADKPFWYNPVVWVTFGFFPMMYWIVGSVVAAGTEIPSDAPWFIQILKYFGPAFDPQTRAGLINLIVGMVFGGVVGIWFGTSYGSQRKTELATEGKPAG